MDDTHSLEQNKSEVHNTIHTINNYFIINCFYDLIRENKLWCLCTRVKPVLNLCELVKYSLSAKMIIYGKKLNHLSTIGMV